MNVTGVTGYVTGHVTGKTRAVIGCDRGDTIPRVGARIHAQQNRANKKPRAHTIPPCHTCHTCHMIRETRVSKVTGYVTHTKHPVTSQRPRA